MIWTSNLYSQLNITTSGLPGESSKLDPMGPEVDKLQATDEEDFLALDGYQLFQGYMYVPPQSHKWSKGTMETNTGPQALDRA